jgi:ATP-dependent DNA helicase RecG
LRTNLIDTYLQLKEFINRHLPDKFYMEGDQRIDLRDKIFREVIGNIICHREYTDGTATELLIEEDAVRTLNPNNPYFHGIMDLNNFNPHPKNPNIRKFFTALGWADEIGSGIRNTQKYLPRYVENAAPVFIGEPLFRTIIPLVRSVLGSEKARAFIEFVGLQKEKLNNETRSAIESLELTSDLAKNKNLDELFYMLGGSWNEKEGKLKKLRLQINSDLEFKIHSNNKLLGYMNASDIKAGEKAHNFLGKGIIDKLKEINEDDNPVLIEIELKSIMKPV